MLVFCLPKLNQITFDTLYQITLYVLSQRLITLNTPVPIRSPKLSSVEPSQYLDGLPPGNTRCCWLSHPRQCGSTTAPGREQIVLDVSYIPTYGTLSSQELQSQFVSPGHLLKQTNVAEYLLEKTQGKINQTRPSCKLIFPSILLKIQTQRA